MYLWKITQMNQKEVREESTKNDCEQNHSS